MVTDKFEAYVERCSKTYGITPEEAKKLKIVQEVKKYYEKEGELKCEP